MKNLLTGALLLLTTMVMAQEHVPGPNELINYKHPDNKIYKSGWIDFNKNGKKDIYEDPSAPIDERIEDLLSQMTLEEKTCQMVTLYGYKRILEDDLPTPEWKNKIWKDGIGAIDEQLNGIPASTRTNPYVSLPSRHAWALNEIQRFFIENTRLGIPTDFTNEGIRGVESCKATNFPSEIGLGHTWDKQLIHQVGYITGREAHLLGYTNVYAPILDVGRDQRWGRYEEIYGESPFLVAELGIQMTRGIQSHYQVASTAKHFAIYSACKGAREGMARTDPQATRSEVENIFIYPWERVIREGGLLGAMCSYNDYNGRPMAASHYWLTDRLRKQMGFKGYVVSDSDAVEFLFSKHGTAADMKEAVRQTVEAGLNVRCTFRSPDSYVLPLRELVKEGGLSMETINDRVRDILRVKFLVGLFDHPYQTDLAATAKEVNSVEHQRVALRASRECLVLLKNEHKTLPLDKAKIKTISVCGPNADETSFAFMHYGPSETQATSVLQGIKDKMRGKANVIYTKGCDLVDANWPESEIYPTAMTAKEKKDIKTAVENAKRSDVAVVVLGGGSRTCGESKSRSNLDLPGRQLDLLKAIQSTGKPVVLVLINGRPLSINWADKYVPAILEAWYPGAKGGKAIADVLFGDYNPGGKLTVTFPRTVGQIPFNFPFKPYSQVDGGKMPGCKGNMTRINGALYNFGYGLSYTTFRYSDLKIIPRQITDKQHVEISCNITNTGDRAGDEIVQLYTHEQVSSVTTYEKNLRGFERIHLKPGETKTVTFHLIPRDFRLFNQKNEWVVEPGNFNIMVGASSTDIKLKGVLNIVSYAERQKQKDNVSVESVHKSLWAVLDNDTHTVWNGSTGDYLNFPLREGAKPDKIGLCWQHTSKPATFEIQFSSGGGFFETIYKGKVGAKNMGKFTTYPLSKFEAGDLRILITSGKACISEVHLNASGY